MKQAWNRVRRLKGKDPEKVNILEVNGAQYNDSKRIANKIIITIIIIINSLFHHNGHIHTYIHISSH